MVGTAFSVLIRHLSSILRDNLMSIFIKGACLVVALVWGWPPAIVLCLWEWWKRRQLLKELFNVDPLPGPGGGGRPTPPPPPLGSVAAFFYYNNEGKRVNIGPPVDGEQLYQDKNGRILWEKVATDSPHDPVSVIVENC